MLVVYHGVDPWNTPTRFRGLYANPSKTSSLSVDFGYVLIDLSKMTSRSMPEHAELGAGLTALKHSKRRVLSPKDAELIARALKVSDPRFRQITVDYLDRAFATHAAEGLCENRYEDHHGGCGDVCISS